MAQLVSVAPNTPPAPSLQEATRNSTQAWQTHLESLFHHAKDRFPDVVWEFVAEGADEQDPEDYGPSSVMAKLSNGPGLGVIEEVWGHKAIVYARAPPSFQSRYFRPIGGAPSPLPYPAESNLSLGYADPSTSTPALGALVPRTPSPYGRPASPTTTLATSHAPTGQTGPSLLRLTTSINPTLFSNELEYLYTGKGFGEAFEFLFDSSEAREHGLLTNGSAGDGSEVDEAEALRIDKLRKDLVFMWRSRLYSDVRLALTGNFGGSHESTTAIFSSHRFILVSRCSYFHTALIAWPTKTTSTNGEPPTLNLPSPPFTPASLHFTLGFIYTGTLVFSHRSYDLSTAFAILRAALYLTLPSLQDEIQARIAQEMCHGLFHAFLPFSEYESITGGRWGTGGCRCRQCARRAPRVLEFALAEDVHNTHLERGARRALVGLFGEGWCNVEFASLPQKIRDSVVRGVGKRTSPLNAFALLWAAEHALAKLESNIDVWKETVKDMIVTVRKGVDECVAKEAEQCFESEEWMEIVESEGARFEDGERVEWAMKAVLRGVKEGWAALLYQTLVSSILLRPHPTDTNAPQLSATSHIRVAVEEARVELLKWIAKRWLAIRQERGFDALEGWAIKEISDHIEVPINDLLNPPAYSSPKSQSPASATKRAQGTAQRSTHSALLLRPISSHPHTSKVDPESDVASSMRVSVLSRNLPTRSVGSSVRDRDRERVQSSASSARSLARSTTESVASNSTVSATPRRRVAAGDASGPGMSPAKRLANEVRAGRGPGILDKDEDHDRPDSKLTPSASYVSLETVSSVAPSIVEPRGDDRYSMNEDGEYADGEEGYGAEEEDVTDEGYQEDMDVDHKEGDSILGDERSEYGHRDTEDRAQEDSHDGDAQTESDMYENAREELDPTSSRSSVTSSRVLKGKGTENPSTPVKKTLITRASLASVQSKKSALPSSTSPTNSTPGAARLKSSSASVKSTNTLRKTSTTTSPVRSPTNAAPRPSSRGSTRSTATSRLNVSVTGSGARAKPVSRPVSRPTSRLSTTSTNRVSTASTATGSAATFRTASTSGALATPIARSRRTSAASNASVRTAGPPSPVNERSRKISSTSISSVASARSTAASTKTTPRVMKKSVSAGAADSNKLSPAAAIAVSASTGKIPSSTSTRPRGTSTPKKPVPVPLPSSRKSLASKKSAESLVPPTPPSKTVSVVADPASEPVVEVKDTGKDSKAKNDAEKENVVPPQAPLADVPEEQQGNDAPMANTSSTMTIKARPRPDILSNEHKKTSSAASISSVATVTKRGSTDTIKTVKSGAASSVALSSASGGSGKQNRPLPPPPQEEQSLSMSARAPLAPHPQHQASSSTLSSQPSSIDQVLADYVPQGATLEIGIPCIISSKRKRFKAYARYIGEVRGETGPWVGVEVPMPIGGDTWGDRDLDGSVMSNASRRDDDRQWNDGSWGGIRYFEIGGAGSEVDYGEDRASRRRRIDAGSVGGAVWGRVDGKGMLKREGDQLSIASERMKRMRSVSPAVSEMSGTESRGLFVRPQQVLYVMDAVDSDL